MNDIEIRKKNADYLTAVYSALNDVEDSDFWKERLDGTLESLTVLDELIEELWQGEPPSEKMFDFMVTAFGSYVGDVIQRAYSGEWEITSENTYIFQIEITETLNVGASVFSWVYDRFKSKLNIADTAFQLSNFLEETKNSNSDNDHLSPASQMGLTGWDFQSIVAQWLSDSAGLILGAFSCDASENAENGVTTFQIEIEKTPLIFVTEEHGFEAKSISNNEASIAAKVINDGRKLPLYIESDERGTLALFAYLGFSISKSNYEEASVIMNKANELAQLRCNLEFIEQTEGDRLIIVSKCLIENNNPSEEIMNEILFSTLNLAYKNWHDFEKFIK